MKQYRGYYIDGAILTSEADIDAAIKANNIRVLKIRMNLFAYYTSTGRTQNAMAISIEADRVAEYLVKHCGMTWDEVEAIEIEAMA